MNAIRPCWIVGLRSTLGELSRETFASTPVATFSR